MKKKYWFGTYHNSYASTNYALNVIKRHTLGDKLYNGEYTVEAGTNYPFKKTYKEWFDRLYDESLHASKDFLEHWNLLQKPKWWGVRYVAKKNYPLIFLPHNHDVINKHRTPFKIHQLTGTEWVEIRAKRLFSCFASKKSEEKVILRKQAGPKDWYLLWRSKNYVCSECGLRFDHYDQLQNHHEGMKFKDIFEKFKKENPDFDMYHGAKKLNEFREFHDQHATTRWVCKGCHLWMHSTRKNPNAA
tara:strand:- start:23 stop:757 length:735 start_codon:yes stop_codon:yes gene_type:complete